MTWISLEADINMKVYTSPQPMIFFLWNYYHTINN